MRITMETKCDTCIGYKDGWCRINKHATNAINYGCRQHITQEEYDKRMAEVDKKLNEQKAIRVNYMLTMMYTFLNAGLTLMTKSETIFDELVSGKNWRFERKKAMKKMMANMEEVRNLYARYFEKDFVDMMTNYGESEFDNEQYDSFTADAADFLRLGLTFYEHAYTRPEDKDKAIALIATMPHDLNLFDDKFIESFRQR